MKRLETQNQETKIAYFGGEPLAVPVLEELKACGIVPDLIVCNPDRPQGRKMLHTPPPTKVWAEEYGIPVFQPESLKSLNESKTVGHPMSNSDWDLFVVVAYNHIFPKWLIDVPRFGTINLHPSMLPLYRGPSPIRSAILEDNKDGVGASVMLLDEKMDHGPLLAQMKMEIANENWPIRGNELDLALARMGGALLADTIPKWIAGEINPQEQNHELATYTKKFEKADGEVTLDPHNPPTGKEARELLSKIHAFDSFPSTFFIHEGKRIKIIDVEIRDNKLHITKVIPEGKKEMDFETYLESSKK